MYGSEIFQYHKNRQNEPNNNRKLLKAAVDEGEVWEGDQNTAPRLNRAACWCRRQFISVAVLQMQATNKLSM